jgi:hypothetical protein
MEQSRVRKGWMAGWLRNPMPDGDAGESRFRSVNHLPVDIIRYILSQMLPTEAMSGSQQFR